MTETDAPTATSNRIVIAGKYEVFLDEELGSGGLAIVYRGRDLRNRRDVAVKALRGVYRASPEARRRFRQEARMMAFVSHPGLVTFHELLERADESWIVMELVSGRNLKQLVEQDGPQSVARVVSILDQMSRPLEHLHSHKIVHLDIKPQNIILTGDGGIKLIDFGLAQSFAPRQDTIGGSTFGTAAYLSPEQGRGEPVDQRTDVYALGCVTYELLTGGPPFDAPDGPDQKAQLISSHIQDEPVAPSQRRAGLPFWIDDVVGRALEKAPEHRFVAVRAFVDAAISGLAGAAQPLVDPTQALIEVDARPPRLRFARRRQPSTVVLPEAPDDDERDDVPGIGRRAWRAGGRIARRSRPLHRSIWRLAIVFAFANIILGTALVVRTGPESLVERFLAIVPGTTTEVAVDSLNLRSGPGADNPVLTMLDLGDEVNVTGLSVADEQGRWWPVETEQDGIAYEGWVWDGGLQPNGWTGRMSFMQGVSDGIGNGADRVGDLWPF